MPASKNVVKVGNHYGSKTAKWVVEKTEPDAGQLVPVAVDGPKDNTPVEVEEVKQSASRTQVSRNGDGTNSASTNA